MKKIICKITSVFSEKILLNKQENFLCAVSGGQDSILLFFVLFYLQKQWNRNIKVLHFHHFWQEKNFSSMYHVCKLLFVFKTPLYLVFSKDVLENEKKARQWRQYGLNRVSTIENCTKIFTGHTASDQLETAVWHLLRGTSPQGFGSLKYETILLSKEAFFKNPKFYHSSQKCSFSKHFVNSLFVKKIKTSENRKLFPKKIFFSKKLKQKKILVLGESNFNYIYKKIPNKKNLHKSVSLNISKNTVAFLSLSKKLRFFEHRNRSFLKKNSPALTKKLRFFGTKTKTVFSQTLIFFLFNLKILRFGSKNNKLYCFSFFNRVFCNKKIIRPLLVFHRNDITFFSQKYLLPVMYDPTNTKLYWSRNRIRHQIFPVMRFFFNPQTDYVLNNFLEITHDEQKYIESSINKIIQYWVNSYYETIVSKQIYFVLKQQSDDFFKYFIFEKQEKGKNIYLFTLGNETFCLYKNQTNYFSEYLVENHLLQKQDFFRIFMSRISSQFQIFPKAVQRILVQKIFPSYTRYQLNRLQNYQLRKKM